MKLTLPSALALIWLVGSGQPIHGQPTSGGPNGPGRWTVVYRSATLPANAASRIAAFGGRVEAKVNEVGVLTASGNAAFAAKLAADKDVLAVGPERFHTLPPVTMGGVESDVPPLDAETFGAPTGTDTLYQIYGWNIRRIGAPAMWARVPMDVQATATVAVLDTGVMHTHPDLAGQVVAAVATNYCHDSMNGSDAYPVYRTLIDFDAHPEWDPSMGCASVDTIYHSHGTHVAGTIAAKFGGSRVVGVAPGVRIAAYKVFDRYRFTLPGGQVVDDVGAFDGPVFTAIVDAALHHYQVINMSLGGTLYRNNKSDNASWLAWDRVAKFADKMGTTIVAAAGNDGVSSNGTIASIPSDLPTVISVTATGSSNLTFTGGAFNAAPGSDVLAFYSNTGAAKDIAAPGGDCGPGYPASCQAQYLILSTFIFETGLNAGLAGFAFEGGTSMASPHVAAVAAVVRALHPDWNPGQVRAFMKSSADQIGSRQAFGHGLVNADTASK
jgi:subtilisin family serine protease